MRIRTWSICVKRLFAVGLFACMWLMPLRASAAPAQQTLPPPNDNFADATPIGSIPWAATVTLDGATTEDGETAPYACGAYNGAYQTVWYSYTPQSTATVVAYTNGWPNFLTVYQGSSLADLQYISCALWSEASFYAEAGKTYYVQAGTTYGGGGQVDLRVEPAPPPTAAMYYYPTPVNTYTNVEFRDNSYGDYGLGFASELWDFGDGTTASGPVVNHTFAKEGTYAVRLTVTTADGRTGSTSEQIVVETHDVAITKFTVPTSARAGQTKSISVGISNKLHDEWVAVSLYRSLPAGSSTYTDALVGTLTQLVPVRSANRTTPFDFTYTFSAADAQQGTMTFKVEATLIDHFDALQGDNTAISLPIKVSGVKAAAAGESTPVSDGLLFLPMVGSE
ncbi:MAG: PKD domain-containing protein [Caldilineaceae bacterium]